MALKVESYVDNMLQYLYGSDSDLEPLEDLDLVTYYLICKVWRLELGHGSLHITYPSDAGVEGQVGRDAACTPACHMLDYAMPCGTFNFIRTPCRAIHWDSTIHALATGSPAV